MALMPPGLLLFYVLTVDRLGFLPTAGVMVLMRPLALGARLRLAIPLAIVAPLSSICCSPSSCGCRSRRASPLPW